MKKILVVNVNWLGDVVFSSPVFYALKKRYPEATISCLGPPRITDVLECIPAVDHIIVYDEKGRHRSLLGKLRLIVQLRKHKFDSVFLLHRSLTRALLVYWAGIPIRVGYPTKKRGRFLTHHTPCLHDDHSLHRSEYYLNVLRSFGIKISQGETCLSPTEQAMDAVNQTLRSENLTNRDYLIGINPGGNWELKTWSERRYALLIDWLFQNHPVTIILIGAPKDIPRIERIMQKTRCHVINLAGQLTLKQSIALFKKLDLVISADSGPLHLANSVGTDVIGIFGPTRVEITGPRGNGDQKILRYDVGCNRNPCYYLQCQDNVCMQAVTVQDVMDAVEELKKAKKK
jgi:lipopolysaccharide heptosyltransferase II